MRWPFHFGKAARAEGKSGSEPAAPPRRRDWESLPPIQRAIGEAPLTAHSVEFGESLAGSDEPALALEPLGHHRSPDAPQGLVIGLANPIASYAPSTELNGRPRRRSAPPVSVQAMPADVSSSSEPDTTGELDAIEPAEPELPMRVLPPVAIDAPTTPGTGGRLTDASRVEVAPLRPVQRSTFEPMVAQAFASQSVPASPPTGMRLNLGLSRRHGLGAPMREVPAGVPPPATQISPPAERTATEAQPSSAESPAATQTQTASGVPSVKLEPDSEPERLTMRLPELRPLPPFRKPGGRSRSEGDEIPSPPAPSEADLDVAPAAIGVPGQALPTASMARPLSIQRQSATDPSPSPALQLRSTLEPRRQTPTAPLTSARPALTTVSLRREPAMAGAPATQPAYSVSTFRDMPQPAVQRWPVASAVPVSAPRGVTLPAGERRHEPGPLVWNVQRQAAGSAPGEEPTAEAPAAGEGPSAGTPAMAAAPAMAPSGGAAPAASGGGAPPGPHAAEGPAAAGGSAPSGGAAPGGHDEKEIHELAEQLYPMLTSMLRREVLTERERAGFVTDLR